MTGADTTAAAVRRQLVLGLDCSTQSISAVVLDAITRSVVHESALRFDDELPAYGTTNGVQRDPGDPNVVRVPSLMLIDALDRIFAKLATHSDKFKLQHVVAISGSAQQHTSAYWRRGFSLPQCMASADVARPLVAPFAEAKAFSVDSGPSWMDSSSSTFCLELERDLGGADRVASISGSRAYPRFTGNQIAKLIHDDPTFLDRTGRVSLASSLLTSILVGSFTPIDASDGSGMNLLDLGRQEWSSELLQATVKHATQAPDRAARLLLEALGPEIVPPHKIIGHVHPYFQRKFGFAEGCQVASFTGDNPCTLAGIGLSQTGDVGVSLGTSTTLMAIVDQQDTSCARDEGHFFLNPVDPSTLMAMICFKNGALAREEVRDECAEGWDDFGDLLRQSHPGNGGVMGFFMRDPEITPFTSRPGVVVFDGQDQEVDSVSSLPATVRVRAIVESQCLALRLHAESLGVRKWSRLVATGGGAVSDGFLQVLADVFRVPVLRLGTVANSAALGAALRAHHAIECRDGFVPYRGREALRMVEAAHPRAAASAVYDSLLDRYACLEKRVVSQLS